MLYKILNKDSLSSKAYIWWFKKKRWIVETVLMAFLYHSKFLNKLSIDKLPNYMSFYYLAKKRVN